MEQSLPGNREGVIRWCSIPSRPWCLPGSVLSRLQPGTLLIDLASAPGGVDREAAEKLGIRVIPALSLPGKVAPRAAGEIIKETIYHMMEEWRSVGENPNRIRHVRVLLYF